MAADQQVRHYELMNSEEQVRVDAASVLVWFASRVELRGRDAMQDAFDALSHLAVSHAEISAAIERAGL